MILYISLYMLVLCARVCVCMCFLSLCLKSSEYKLVPEIFGHNGFIIL